MDRQRLFAVCNSSESRFIIFCRPDSLCVRYSLLVVGAVGDFWRSKTMTAPVDPVETIFWHRSLRPRSLLPARCITIRRKGPNWEVLDDIKCPPRLASETDNKDALASGKNRSTLLPNIPPHFEIKITAAGQALVPLCFPRSSSGSLAKVAAMHGVAKE